MVGYGQAVNVIAFAFYIVLTLLFYSMFKVVNRSLSLLAALFSLVGCAVGLLGLFPRTSLPINPLWFFGPYCLLIGALIIRSAFLPPLIGWLMVAAGLGWLAFLSPPIARHLSLYIEIIGSWRPRGSIVLPLAAGEGRGRGAVEAAGDALIA